jgi:hypothetical protein
MPTKGRGKGGSQSQYQSPPARRLQAQALEHALLGRRKDEAAAEAESEALAAAAALEASLRPLQDANDRLIDETEVVDGLGMGPSYQRSSTLLRRSGAGEGLRRLL